LAADVRVTAERKLKSLEEDLAKAEQSRKERKMATKYHKVKFFGEQNGPISFLRSNTQKVG